MSGYIFLHRGWRDNGVFAVEPYTERDAWVWLIETAAWKPALRRAPSGATIAVQRGQIHTAHRTLATVWGWDRKRVDRFLKRLERFKMVDTKAGHQGTIITICNYSKYQHSGAADGATEGPPKDHQRATQEEGKEGKEDISLEPNGSNSSGDGSPDHGDDLFGGALPAEDPAVKYTAAFEAFWQAFPRKTGKGAAATAYAKAAKLLKVGRHGARVHALLLRSAEAFAALSAGKDQQYLPHAATWLNQKRWTDDAIQRYLAEPPPQARPGMEGLDIPARPSWRGP